MSKVTNYRLTRSGTGCFIAVPLWQQWAAKGKPADWWRAGSWMEVVLWLHSYRRRKTAVFQRRQHSTRNRSGK